ncbi:MAG: hypothetical protein MN733_15440, partial [Nitrososphaera sp.]|nr:hypothetical protein [Nitrososphaera sp.]
MKRALIQFIVFLLFLCPLLGQDTTCNAGDIMWVVETVNANIGTANAGAACLATVAGAEYNNIATPFGIQGAADCACAGAIIRVITGVGNYGATTASWNNRDAADKQINFDAIAGTTEFPINVEGWINGTTRGLATLQFERATIAGALGFNIQQPRYVLRDIRITQTDTSGIDLGNGTEQTFFSVEVDNNGSGALVTGGGGTNLTIIDSWIHNGAAEGVNAVFCV